ncbi:MAG: plasmid stabilization protein [Candidatus Harrisonbacteria bacterium CG10_big_fil_rev_8_21_14_0_10_49_15]|uniref:Plasmid stabilization protein n=1 Tax=Candidatus Harrisonbacteria bacterium CG10_big_fil_rev_8_21_14_0_10_49_15 TaxID=1974587 RepID=A0A2H0UJV5_9BACT|nr:MAG: plasmid stabilization protein [Candidatus Harrisonbacteria bacterium CG10_big_fil_rev_8_21_14_0_10_49_15]
MAYAVIVHAQASKAIGKLPTRIRTRVFQALCVLVDSPFIGKKLAGKLENEYSYRLGSYRIIYQILQKKLIVIVLDVGPRGGIYK